MRNVNTISPGIMSHPAQAVAPPEHNTAKNAEKILGANHGRESVNNEEQLKKIVAEIAKTVSPLNIDLKFSCYGPNNQYLAVTVINKETGEIVREIPSAEMKKLYSRSKDLSGLILNNSI